MEPELCFVDFHHLDRKVRIHRFRFHFRDKFLHLRIESIQRIARCQQSDILRPQSEAKRVKIFVNGHGFQKFLVGDLMRIAFSAGDHMHSAKEKPAISKLHFKLLNDPFLNTR